MFFLYNNFFSWLKCDSELKAWWINEKDVFSLLPPSNRRVWRTFQDMKINYWKIIFLILLYFNINLFGAHTHTNVSMCVSGTDRTNVCWVKEGCSSLQPKACSSLPLEVVDYVDEFDAKKLNLYLNTGCYTGDPKRLQAQLDNAPASCDPPCFRITKPGEYCYISTRNNNFSNRRHMGQITVTEPPE